MTALSSQPRPVAASGAACATGGPGVCAAASPAQPQMCTASHRLTDQKCRQTPVQIATSVNDPARALPASSVHPLQRRTRSSSLLSFPATTAAPLDAPTCKSYILHPRSPSVVLSCVHWPRLRCAGHSPSWTVRKQKFLLDKGCHL